MTSWQFTPISLLYFAGLAVALVVAALAWRLRPIRGARHFSIMSLTIACWIGGFILGFFNADPQWKWAAVRVEYIGIVGAPVLFFLFVADYVQLRLPPGWQLVLFGPPIVTLLLALTFPMHQLLYIDYGTSVLESGFVVFDKEYGPFFYFWMAASYIILMTSFLVLAWGVARMPQRYRFQAAVLGAIILLILVANIAFVSGFNPISPSDPTPLAFLVAALLVLINMRIYGFLDMAPVAHNLVFQQVPTGVIVLNERDHVIDVNRVAEAIFGPRQELIGQPLETWFQVDVPHREAVPLGDGDREFDIDVTPFTDAAGQGAGKLVLLHDMTERNELTRQQEALIAELRKALADVRLLEGMLPICASCKKIRTAEDEWHELERFIHEHSDAQLSHSICPECARRLYPDFELD